MSTSPYFNNFSHGRTQKVVEDLIIESIKIHGYNVKYLPQTAVNFDKLLKEDTLRYFKDAIDIEVYIKNTKSFDGDREFLGKFGMEIREQITFTMSRQRFKQVLASKVALETTNMLSLEEANVYTMGGNANILLENTLQTDYTGDIARPMEGDLIFFPLVNALFQVTYVDFEASFYSFGKLYTYDIKCELFEYSSERVETDDPIVNDAVEEFTAHLDQAFFELQLEDDSGDILLEDGSYLRNSTASTIEDVDIQAGNKVLEGIAENYIDFSERNPFMQDTRF